MSTFMTFVVITTVIALIISLVKDCSKKVTNVIIAILVSELLFVLAANVCVLFLLYSM